MTNRNGTWAAGVLLGLLVVGCNPPAPQDNQKVDRSGPTPVVDEYVVSVPGMH